MYRNPAKSFNLDQKNQKEIGRTSALFGSITDVAIIYTKYLNVLYIKQI